MSNPYISAFFAITSLSFSDALATQCMAEDQYPLAEQCNFPEYKSDKKNCDLCVNLPKKNKTTQV